MYMRFKNLLSLREAAKALIDLDPGFVTEYLKLKPQEVICLDEMCDILWDNGAGFRTLEGFYTNYIIPQIGKEFDLLRIGTESVTNQNTVINIELKSELDEHEKMNKIVEQMTKNYYYLFFETIDIVEIFTYILHDGFYKFNPDDHTAMKVEPAEVVASIKKYIINEYVDLEKLFVPSKYLISPFNNTDTFLNDHYFLTNRQEQIKQEIMDELLIQPSKFFTISANAGTGKTLLLYDFAKYLIRLGKNVLIVHCGKLNAGHTRLIEEFNWNIKPIRSIPHNNSNAVDDCDFLIVDESHRINHSQLESLVLKAKTKGIPALFSYDTKQYLHISEKTDIADYLHENHPDIVVSKKRLTDKIRTNKNMVSFIKNLQKIGSCKENLHYEHVSVEYFSTLSDTEAYIGTIINDGWTPVTYTTSHYNLESYSRLSNVSGRTAHDVIGQEFSKVTLVMDNNFWYDNKNKLCVNGSYYSAEGMLYQIVTRAVDDLKIIVLDNPELYKKLIEIKRMGD